MSFAKNFLSFLDSSPGPFHAAENLVDQFVVAGWTVLKNGETWSLKSGQGYVVDYGPGCVAAFTLGTPGRPEGWKIAAAHTDSPGLKIKAASVQRLDAGLVRWGVEVYGGPLFATWTDRTLGLAGIVWLTGDEGPKPVCIKTEGLATIPNLALHFNRDANKGFALEPQTHLSAIADPGPFSDWANWLAKRMKCAREDFLSADLFLYDVQPAAVIGQSGLYQSGRIDNLAGCHAVAQALIHSSKDTSERYRLALFLDHEEIGSRTPQGADSQLLSSLLERLNDHALLEGENRYRQKAASFLVSVDAAHGLHPNYSDLHDPAYSPKLGLGPVLKSAARYSYATTAETTARFRWMVQRYQGNLQEFILRSDLTPGSTVGPLLAASAGVPAIDLGVPIWGMHSVRETGHIADQDAMIDLLKAFWD